MQGNIVFHRETKTKFIITPLLEFGTGLFSSSVLAIFHFLFNFYLFLFYVKGIVPVSLIIFLSLFFALKVNIQLQNMSIKRQFLRFNQ
jgi:hypothetical protein